MSSGRKIIDGLYDAAAFARNVKHALKMIPRAIKRRQINSLSEFRPF